ncbi:MAG: hypothetical protein JW798_06705, partial [Prolixibacteraceae bacterium]|nr:hypothetical protein [Prolixibacteraceae bacterium]
FVVVKAERYINHRSNEQFDIEVRQINEENSAYSGGYVFIFSYYYRIAFRNIDYAERLDLVDYISLDSFNVIQTDYGYTYHYKKQNRYAVELLDSNIACIYYNFNYGLIKYELKNGETFTIDEELLRR